MERQLTNDGTLMQNTTYSVNNIYLNGVRIAALTAEGETRFYLTDQVDSVSMVLSEQGKPLTAFEYLPYGETWLERVQPSLKEKHNPKYNSQELDTETDFYYYNARYYDPEISRFVTADTVIDGEHASQGWNRYMYVKGNPILYKDANGHDSESVPGGDRLQLDALGSAPNLIGTSGNPGGGKNLQDSSTKRTVTPEKSGNKVIDEMLSNLSAKPDANGNFTTKLNGAQINLSTQYIKDRDSWIDSMKKTSENTLNAFNDMIGDVKLDSVTVSRMFQKNGGVPHDLNNKGYAIDITAATKGKDSVWFNDTSYNEQKNQPKLAEEMTNSLRKDPRVQQVLTPWKIKDPLTNRDGDNEKRSSTIQEKPLDHGHVDHMHFGTYN